MDICIRGNPGCADFRRGLGFRVLIKMSKASSSLSKITVKGLWSDAEVKGTCYQEWQPRFRRKEPIPESTLLTSVVVLWNDTPPQSNYRKVTVQGCLGRQIKYHKQTKICPQGEFKDKQTPKCFLDSGHIDPSNKAKEITVNATGNNLNTMIRLLGS